jgi:pimeloyl-ACP methyl ester carboxylesterase
MVHVGLWSLLWRGLIGELAGRYRCVTLDVPGSGAGRPTLTVFGQLGDYFFFRRKWRALRPDLSEAVVPWGLHFPMADNPALVAGRIRAWHRAQVRRS